MECLTHSNFWARLLQDELAYVFQTWQVRWECVIVQLEGERDRVAQVRW